MASLSLWNILSYTWFAVELYVLFTTRVRNRSQGKSPDRGSLIVLWVVIFWSIFLASAIAVKSPATRIYGVGWMRPAALVLLAVGLIVRITAIYTLGRSFTANVSIREAQTLQQNGLFRYMRHPSYTGMVLIFLALGLRMQNWLSLLIVFVPPVAALMYRIHVEEAALTGAFGEQYVAYSQRTKRLIPGIY
jgi:protein-S-isoprenylcysteine O-methyltransferase Ste14